MKKKLLFSVVFILCALLPLCAALAGEAFSDDPDAIEAAAKSVFLLTIYSDDYKDAIATGSGFLMFDNITLVTNYHVIEDADVILAESDEGYEYYVTKVLVADETNDLAILRFMAPTTMQPLEASTAKLRRGETVTAIGSPEGIKNTVSIGNVSYVGKDYAGNDCIQFTASISHGSSGGALFEDYGKVAGVTSSAIMDNNAQNLNFAIPIEEVLNLYAQWDGKTTYDISDYEQARVDKPKPTPTPTPTPAVTSKFTSGMYGYINSNGVHLWSRTSPSSKKIATYNYGTLLTVFEKVGKNYYHVEMEDGNTGYVVCNFVTTTDTIQTERPTPTPTSAMYGYINSNGVHLWSRTTPSSKKIATYNYGTLLTVFGKVGNNYYHVEMEDGNTGYIVCSFVTFTDTVLIEQPTPTPSATPTASPTPKPTSTLTPAPTQVPEKTPPMSGHVSSNSVVLWSSTSKGAQNLGEYHLGASLTILEELDNGFYHVKMKDGKTGYIRKYYVNIN